MKSYLVTGGAGFIGSSITRKLVQQGFKVRVLDNQSRGSLKRLKDIKNSFEFINGDIRDFKTVLKSSKNIDSIIHLAYINGTEFFYTKPELVLEVGVKGIINVIDSAIKNSIPEIFLASSSEVYNLANIIPTPENIPMIIPDPFNPRFSYSGGKIISELMLLNYGRKHFKRVVVFRPHNVYGPDMGWEHAIPQFVLRMKQLIKKKKKGLVRLPIQGTGEETRSFIYINDFANGFMTLLSKAKNLNIYNLGSQDEVKIKNIVYMIGDYFQRDIKIIPGKLSEGSTLRRVPDLTKITKLGFKTQIPLASGVKKTVEWYDQNSN